MKAIPGAPGGVEKAEELIERFSSSIGSNCEHDSYCTDKECQRNGGIVCKVDWETAKECALICVDEITSEGATQYGVTAVEYGRETFWQSVKQEIAKILN